VDGVNGNASIYDMWSNQVGVPKMDNGTSNVVFLAGEEVDGVTTVKFSRNLKSTDKIHGKKS
jgi:hypothetical protein